MNNDNKRRLTILFAVLLRFKNIETKIITPFYIFEKWIESTNEIVVKNQSNNCTNKVCNNISIEMIVMIFIIMAISGEHMTPSLVLFGSKWFVLKLKVEREKFKWKTKSNALFCFLSNLIQNVSIHLESIDAIRMYHCVARLYRLRYMIIISSTSNTTASFGITNS